VCLKVSPCCLVIYDLFLLHSSPHTPALYLSLSLPFFFLLPKPNHSHVHSTLDDDHLPPPSLPPSLGLHGSFPIRTEYRSILRRQESVQRKAEGPRARTLDATTVFHFVYATSVAAIELNMRMVRLR